VAIDHAQRRHVTLVEPDTDLAKILDEASDHPVVLEWNGIRFHIEREPSTPVTPRDPEEFREALRQSAGAFAGIDKEAYEEDLRFWRGEDNVDDAR